LNPAEYPWAAPRIPPAGAVRGADRFPTGLAEALAGLRRRLRTAEREILAELPEDRLSDLQRQWRPMLATVLGLDGTNRALLDALGTQDPDEASRRVIVALWRELRLAAVYRSGASGDSGEGCD
jgi:hypothetical protein